MSDDVLLTSVPVADHAWVRSLLPGAVVTEAPLSEALADAYPDVSVLSVMVHDPVPEEVVCWWPGLAGVVTRSTGFDHLPMEVLRGRGVEVCALQDYAVSSVAHLTVAFVLSLLRRVPEAMALTSGARTRGRVPSWDRSRLVGRHVADVEVGVLGVGRVGGAVARALTDLGARVRGFDVAPDPAMRSVPRFRFVEPLEAFVEGLDVLTVHVPLSPATRGLVDGSLIGRLAHGAVLVNTARGEVVDQAAVAEALRSGRLGGYGADVLPDEPRPNLSRFQDFTNVILTPHLGAYDQRAIRARYEETAAAVRAIRSGDQALLARYRAGV